MTTKKPWSGKTAKGYKWNGLEWRMRREAKANACKHPPARLYTGVANNENMKPERWVGCCACGEVLVGGAK